MYKVEPKLLKKYAQVMVHYGLNGGSGINKGETVFLTARECSRDLFVAIIEEIILAGGNVIQRYLLDGTKEQSITRFLLEEGSEDQISYFPKKYWQGIVDSVDHIISIIGDSDSKVLECLPSAKISMMNNSMSPYMTMRSEKEHLNKLSWTLCLYGTQSMADEAGLSLEEYWEQIIEACYLREEDPVKKWKDVQEEITSLKAKLDSLKIEALHIQGEDVDLKIKIGENRKWLGGTGRNIPSFEVFISPDWRGTNGFINFNQPLYYSGKRISGVRLVFKDGVVITSSATENEDALKEMISQESADKVGEFSLTDRRHSRITKFMATTLFDENVGGEYGNTHIALGSAYKDSFPGIISEVKPEEWDSMGYNSCPKVHTDIVSTTNRVVTAIFADGSSRVIYQNGEFTLD